MSWELNGNNWAKDLRHMTPHATCTIIALSRYRSIVFNIESSLSVLSTSESEPPYHLSAGLFPALSDLCRKCKADTDPPPLGKKRASGQALSAGYVPKSVAPAQYVWEFLG